MKTLPASELKAQFSEVLEEVQKGESFTILHGKDKKPVAMIVPFRTPAKCSPRQIGILEGEVKLKFAPDFKMKDPFGLHASNKE